MMMKNYSSSPDWYSDLISPEFSISRSILLAPDEITKIPTDRDRILDFFIIITGWIYFLLWITASYPQFITNYRAKSVAGFSLNYLCLNIPGHLSYSIYNILFYFVPIFDDAYHEEHPHTTLPVYLNDVCYSVHNLIINLMMAIQCMVYERGDQKISTLVQIFVLLLALGASFITSLVSIKWLPLLSITHYLAAVKIVITLTKSIPQIWHNYCRKSTEGWSIVGVLLDIAGSTLSAVQMGLSAYKDGCWHPITGNLGKLGLSLISMTASTIYIVQHFCLYRNHGPIKASSVYFSKEQIDEPPKKPVEEKLQLDTI
ncbi:cystinosin homolog [Brevipalpus obovatus]|uniref:cystinosin homolog n=1 Tax=Brevipalpus obovatus TaxID=246614 RepID=UPI003D9F8998